MEPSALGFPAGRCSLSGLLWSRAATAAFNARCSEAKVASRADSLRVFLCLDRLDDADAAVLDWSSVVSVLEVCWGVSLSVLLSVEGLESEVDSALGSFSDLPRAASSASAFAFCMRSNSS